MKFQNRATDVLSSIFQRSERIISEEDGYSYKTREGEIRNGFATRSAALFDLNNFIEVVSIQADLRTKSFSLAA